MATLLFLENGRATDAYNLQYVIFRHGISAINILGIVVNQMLYQVLYTVLWNNIRMVYTLME